MRNIEDFEADTFCRVCGAVIPKAFTKLLDS